jgi:hypothetical protein
MLQGNKGVLSEGICGINKGFPLRMEKITFVGW